MDYEAALISKVIVDEDMLSVIDARVDVALFTTHPDQWKYLLKFYTDHGTTPPLDAFERAFPDFEVRSMPGPITFLVDELRKKQMHNAAASCMKEMAVALKKRNPADALKAMRSAILATEQASRPVDDLNLAEDPMARVVRYDDLKAKGGITGIPSMWPGLDEVTQGFHPGELIIIVGKSGLGKCVDAESRIVDPVTGAERTIQEVVEGSQGSVWSWDTDSGIGASSIANKVDTGFKECWTYRMESGREVTVTPEHQFLTPDGWVQARLLDEGDYVGLPSRIPEPLEPESFKVKDLHLLALLLSEGSYSGNHVGFSTADPEMIRIAERWVEGTAAKVEHRSNYDYDITVGRVGGHTPNPARRFLQSLGIDGKVAKEKVLPDEIYSLPNDLLAEFVGVFWMGDGYIDQGAPCVTLASERMVQQFQHLLLRFGIQSSLRYKPVKGGFHAWRLRVYSHCAEAFLEQIPLWGEKLERLKRSVSDRKQLVPNPNVGGPAKIRHGGWEKPEVHWDRIAEVSSAGVRKIYDLSVNDTHCFLANDIIVHNTWVETILSRYHWTLGYKPGLFTFEMGAQQIARRFDAVNAGLPYQQFRSGKLTHEQYEDWVKTMRDMEGGRPYWVIADEDGASGVSAIEAKIDQYGLDMAYIDGAYLIEDESGGESGWQRIANVMWALKKLARRKRIPIIVSHQFNKDAKGDQGTADDLAYSDVQKWADLIIGMFQTEALRLNKEMLWRLLKQREGERYEWVSEWDLERMAFIEKDGNDLPPDIEDSPVKF